MKIYERKEDIFSWSNARDAISYIQHKGYFGDSVKELEDNISKNRIKVLTSVDIENAIECFKTNAPDEFEYALFIPSEKIKEIKEPKKYRPFRTLEEFKKTLNNIDFGEPLEIRHKENINEVFVGTFNGYEEENNVLITISLGGWLISPKTLFNLYETFNEKTEEWLPFGVLENE